jgi:pimeloyl-ACP methyl ester carboxylesterase
MSARRFDRVDWLAMGAVALGLAAAANALVARAAERRHPPRGRFLTVDGVRLHVLEAGSPEAPPVVLVHGNGAMAEDFAASGLMAALAGRFRVVAIDRPGFGFSARPAGHAWTARAQAALLGRALDALGVRPAVVYGHSWGAMVALALAADRPGLVRALVLGGGYFHPTLRLDVPLVAVAALPGLGAVLRHTVLPALAWALRGAALRLVFAPAPVSARFRARFPLALTVRPGQLRAVAEDSWLMLRSAGELAPLHHSVLVPATVMAGAGDRLVDPQRQSARLAGRLPRARLVLLPGVGHMVHHSTPEVVADAIAAAGRVDVPAPAA